jgi:hypothetical protein
MFPKSYFASSYFVGYYWPPTEDGPVPVEVDQLLLALRSFTERGRF